MDAAPVYLTIPVLLARFLIFFIIIISEESCVHKALPVPLMIYLGAIPMKDLLLKCEMSSSVFTLQKGIFYFQTAGVATLTKAWETTFLQKKCSGYFSWEWVLDKMFPNNQDALT